ncbi:ABC transporter substrate-binding protein [Spirochaetia bacterium]|nr:ABC transporter substrate-binding protein [Spirochaetia bacterium]
MKKLLLVAVAGLLFAGLFASCSGKGESAPAAAAESGKKQVAVILKATDSEFWQSMALGAKKYTESHPDVEVTIYGPPTEAQIAELVAILENVVSKKPAGILVAPPNADSIVAAVNEAMALGIPVVTADNSITTKVTAHIATDNIVGGAAVADGLVAAIQAKGQALKGSVAIIGPDVFEVIENRIKGFVDRLAIIAPDIKLLPTRYCDNDIAKALNIAQDIMLSTPDLIGFYGANNHSADGIARALRETGKHSVISAAGYDSDPEEVAALADSVFNALIVQDPWALGYKGVEFIMASINGESVPEYFNPGVAVVTSGNMNEPKMKAILDPKLRLEY